ncbi:MAG: hypothetical protein KBC42_02455 [Candidatus Pacebacteria bacterium]|nr:hypothetical protein [Candidatus Paceibacterota bacterium]MBP9780765.1 hypothetical protein [Candidatus Paceibacterota bacterium]
MKKNLIIISGVTGAIGNALLAKFGREENTIVYGISRQAVSMNQFVDTLSGKLFDSTLIGSIGTLERKSYESFATLVDYSKFGSVSYIHAVGLYPFEVNFDGKHYVENDNDGDGIDDRVNQLTYEYFTGMVNALAFTKKDTTVNFKALIFGGIADIHQPIVHESWWRTIIKTKDFMKSSAKNISMHILNISSVLCAHEIVTRPFVFCKTDADPKYWLSAYEVADKTFELLMNDECGFYETDLFHFNPTFREGYYQDRKFTPRKVNELFK